jgi:hypothetical protein
MCRSGTEEAPYLPFCVSEDLVMPHLDAREVDPRDGRWEVWNPKYRVFFWGRFAGGGWSERVLEVSDADITSVLAWADQEIQDSETYQVFAVVRHGGEIGLVRLLGEDPPRS